MATREPHCGTGEPGTPAAGQVTDDKRREVAENLRYAADYPGYEIRYMEQFIAELRETVFCDVCSNAGYSDILQRIADLIDPTCRNVGGERYAFKCSECGCYTTEFDHVFAPREEQERVYGELCDELGIDRAMARFSPVHSSVPSHCPGCGARVVRGDE